jgi:hypothetical protein
MNHKTAICEPAFKAAIDEMNTIPPPLSNTFNASRQHSIGPRT